MIPCVCCEMFCLLRLFKNWPQEKWLWTKQQKATQWSVVKLCAMRGVRQLPWGSLRRRRAHRQWLQCSSERSSLPSQSRLAPGSSTGRYGCHLWPERAQRDRQNLTVCFAFHLRDVMTPKCKNKPHKQVLRMLNYKSPDTQTQAAFPTAWSVSPIPSYTW